MSIPEWQREAARAVPTSVIKEIVAENRGAPGDRGRSPIVHEGKARPNAAVTVPYAKDPPGYRYIDAMLSSQDQADRQDRILEAARRLAAMKGLGR